MQLIEFGFYVQENAKSSFAQQPDQIIRSMLRMIEVIKFNFNLQQDQRLFASSL